MADDAANYEQMCMEANEGPTHEDLYVEKAEREENRVYYPTNNATGYIVDAITGYPQRWKVGSFDSLRLYCVNDSSGLVDENGIKIPFGGEPNRNPNILYYESPEAYQRHNSWRFARNDEFDEKSNIQSASNDWHLFKARMFGSSNQDESAYINMAEYNSWRAEKESVQADELASKQAKCIEEQTQRENNKKEEIEKEKEKVDNFNYARIENKARKKSEMKVFREWLSKHNLQVSIQRCKEGTIKYKEKLKANAEATKIKQARRARNKAKYLKNKGHQKSSSS